MLYKETVPSAILELIQTLQQDKRFEEFYLVGETALSLQIGHRISIDIDFPPRDTFDSNNSKNGQRYLDIDWTKSEIENPNFSLAKQKSEIKCFSQIAADKIRRSTQIKTYSIPNLSSGI